MSSPGGGPVRVLRGVVLAAVSVVLAAGGHVAGGSRLPSISVIVLAMCFAIPACWVFAARQRRLLGIAGVSAALQVAAHVVFELNGCHTASGGVASARMVAAHSVATLVAALVLSRLDGVVWLIYRFVCHRLAVLRFHLGILPAPFRAPVVGVETVRPVSSRGWRAHPRRGPPSPAAA